MYLTFGDSIIRALSLVPEKHRVEFLGEMHRRFRHPTPMEQAEDVASLANDLRDSWEEAHPPWEECKRRWAENPEAQSVAYPCDRCERFHNNDSAIGQRHWWECKVDA
ncbi:hypothetical protein LCGC14_2347420 [marine sediment metagenome]|uniref:Uncharacterized protein n=1 Tax=marine sediment metagenome TaxID=412755 RepID=A0A0F9EMX6_9ZZZZ